MKFIKPLSESERTTLQEALKYGPGARVRQRAHAVYLSGKGFTLSQLEVIFEAERDTLSGWLDAWEAHGVMGLYDAPRSGRPPIYTPEERRRLVELLDDKPQRLVEAQARLAEETGKAASRRTLSRVLKDQRQVWKRVRRALKGRRDPEDFEDRQALLKALHQQELEGKVQVFYFDQAGVSLSPVVPYAWQPIGETRELPVNGHRRLNLLGFLDRYNRHYLHPHEGTVRTETVIQAMEVFIERFADPHRLILVFMDNASIHHSEAFEAQRERWMARGVVVCYLPAYSPELNLIEILWRKIKYEWLPLSAYLSFDKLKKAVAEVIDGIGEKYQITFG